MLDWLWLRDLIWEARWDGLVILAQAVWDTVMAHWWFGPLLIVIAVTCTRRAWVRLIRHVGITFIRGGQSG